MKNIIPKKYNSCNCIENSIANYCDSCNVDFTPLFLLSWDFEYDNSKSALGERIHYHSNHVINIKETFDIMHEYIGISCHEIQHLTQSTIIEKILDGYVIFACMDSYNIPWNSVYQKYHYDHYFLITNILLEEKKLVVIDSFSLTEVMFHDFDIINAFIKCYWIEFSIPTKERQAIVEDFLDKCKKNLESDMFNKIRLFANEFGANDNIDFLSSEIVDIGNSYAVRRISHIANSRFNTALLLKDIFKDNNYDKNMMRIYTEWESVKNLLIKILLSSKSTLLQQMSTKIKQIADLEEEINSKIILDIGIIEIK